jgi:hypothetical protein
MARVSDTCGLRGRGSLRSIDWDGTSSRLPTGSTLNRHSMGAGIGGYLTGPFELESRAGLGYRWSGRSKFPHSLWAALLVRIVTPATPRLAYTKDPVGASSIPREPGTLPPILGDSRPSAAHWHCQRSSRGIPGPMRPGEKPRSLCCSAEVRPISVASALGAAACLVAVEIQRIRGHRRHNGLSLPQTRQNGDWHQFPVLRLESELGR